MRCIGVLDSGWLNISVRVKYQSVTVSFVLKLYGIYWFKSLVLRAIVADVNRALVSLY